MWASKSINPDHTWRPGCLLNGHMSMSISQLFLDLQYLGERPGSYPRSVSHLKLCLGFGLNWSGNSKACAVCHRAKSPRVWSPLQQVLDWQMSLFWLALQGSNGLSFWTWCLDFSKPHCNLFKCSFTLWGWRGTHSSDLLQTLLSTDILFQIVTSTREPIWSLLRLEFVVLKKKVWQLRRHPVGESWLYTKIVPTVTSFDFLFCLYLPQ